MPKKEEPKKKVVVVEEVEMNDEPVVVEESPKEEAKTENGDLIINSVRVNSLTMLDQEIKVNENNDE